MLKRLNKKEFPFQTHDISILKDDERFNDNKLLAEQILTFLNRPNTPELFNYPITKRSKVLLLDGLNQREINHFYRLNEISDQMKMVKQPLLDYIKKSKLKNQIPQRLLHRYLNYYKDCIELDNPSINTPLSDRVRSNASYLSYHTFSDILRDRNAILRYASYQRKEIFRVVNSRFRFSTLMFKAFINPFKYWNSQTFRILSARVVIRKQFIGELHHNKILTESALNQTIDNFFHRWFYCTPPSSLLLMSDIEKESICVFLSQKEVVSRILSTPLIPFEVKEILMDSPFEAFKLMLSKNKYTSNPETIESDEEGLLLNKLDTSFNDNPSQTPYPSSLFDMLKALINDNAAKQLYGEKMAVADGILFHAKSSALSRRSKRRKHLLNYMGLFKEIEEVLKSIRYDFVFIINSPFHASFLALLDELILYKQKNNDLLFKNRESKEVQCLLNKLIEGLRQIELPNVNQLENDERLMVKT
jgi:hypothetical protein